MHNGAYPDADDIDCEDLIIRICEMFDAFKIGNDVMAIEMAKKIAEDVTGGTLP